MPDPATDLDADRPDFTRGRQWHAQQAAARREWTELRDLAVTVPCRCCGMPAGASCVSRLPGEKPALLKRVPGARVPDQRREEGTAMTYQPYPPHETARADQHYALVGEELDLLIETFRQISDGLDRARRLDLVAARLTDPRHGDGNQLSHADHVSTLANMLTVAIDRLAAKP